MSSHIETATINPSINVMESVNTMPSSYQPSQNCSVKQLAQEKVLSDRKIDLKQAFFVGDLGEVFRQHIRWKSISMRIDPFFAVKCNPDPVVLRSLSSLGLGFECTSKPEIQQLLNVDVDPHCILFTNPCKQASLVRFAAQLNVKRMTFDSTKELHTIKKMCPDADLVLRITLNDPSLSLQLDSGTGAPLQHVEGLLQTAKELNLNVIGMSFYVDKDGIYNSLECTRRVFDQAKQMGFKWSLLYIRGIDSNEKLVTLLNPMLECMFSPDIRIIAETGAYYVSSAFTLYSSIIGRRATNQMFSSEKQQFAYHISDGIYDSFNCIMFDQPLAQPKVLMKDEKFFGEQQLVGNSFDSSIWGPTSDPLDCLNKSVKLPLLGPGDWIYYENMGAYTIRTASQFNGFKKPQIFFTNTIN
ncbi:pyridoxal-dependent decarboxylase [Sporodiniella umbellata]|nr:pyridoxal-dependent decarboxylase [Sporodiniella umbellata]